MRTWLTPRRLLSGALILLVLIQLVPTWLWNTNPAVVSQPTWDSPQTQALVQRACFDCHSNQTTWPWYSYVAPASWLITRDVISGRRHLNFDDWQTALARQDRFPLDQQIQREVSRGEMPPSYFTLLHPNSALTDAEKQQLIDGMAKTVQAK
jgi:mono/diheme cytochrome c family protein